MTTREFERVREICAVLNAEAFAANQDVLVSYAGTEACFSINIDGPTLYDDQVDSRYDDQENDILTVDTCRKRIVLFARMLLSAYDRPKKE